MMTNTTTNTNDLFSDFYTQKTENNIVCSELYDCTTPCIHKTIRHFDSTVEGCNFKIKIVKKR